MITGEIKVRVRYAETDQMGFVYYGNYATYYEVARVELFRQVGFDYREMEEKGVLMPVLEYKTKFIKPAKYDDEITIKITIKDKPSLRIKFDYEAFGPNGDLLNKAYTELVFLNAETMRPCLPPDQFMDLLNQHFVEV